MICAQCEFSCSCLRAEDPVQMADITLNTSSQRVTGSPPCCNGAGEDEFLCFSISSFVLVGLKIKSLQLCGINKQHRWSISRNSLDHSRINSRRAPRITSAFLCRSGFSKEAERFREGAGKGIKSGVPKVSEVARLHSERCKNTKASHDWRFHKEQSSNQIHEVPVFSFRRQRGRQVGIHAWTGFSEFKKIATQLWIKLECPPLRATASWLVIGNLGSRLQTWMIPHQFILWAQRWINLLC